MFMVLWQSHYESSRGSFDECRTAPSGRRPKTKHDLGCESACTGCQNLHPPSPFIIITQPESWYSFYRPTEGRRLSRPSWLVIYRDGLPVHRRSPILVLTGSDVAQLRWSRPTRWQEVWYTGRWLPAICHLQALYYLHVAGQGRTTCVSHVKRCACYTIRRLTMTCSSVAIAALGTSGCLFT